MKLNESKNISLTTIHILLLIIFSLIVFITAWLCDDAFITFRTVENFVNGFGLVWNVGERVQAYTHPLWMFILSSLYFITKEIYYSSISLSIILSLATFYLIIKKLSVSIYNSFIVAFILISSKAFVDYSTSGLENPFTHFLIVLFCLVYFNAHNSTKKLFLLSLISAAASLNRLDVIIIFIPFLIKNFLPLNNKIKNAFYVFLGFVPLIIWEIFSLLYYGFPFPNTAYAKLNTGIPKNELLLQGMYYILDSLYMDPLTFATLTWLIIFAFIKRKSEYDALVIGVILYLMYIVYVGGDFMSGRFLSAPLLCTSVLISRIEIKSMKLTLVLSVFIVCLGLMSPRPNLLSNANYSLGPKIIFGYRFGPEIIGMKNGITDERYWYYENTGLLNNLFERKLLNHPWVKHGIEIRKTKNELVVKSTTGMFGFFAGSGVHIIDQYALSDPLLSRLPATEYWLIGKEKPAGEKFWRIGHFARKIPEGYLETISSVENKIQHPSLAKYYEKLSVLIKGEMFTWKRIMEIWNFNTGKYDYLINEYNTSL